MAQAPSEYITMLSYRNEVDTNENQNFIRRHPDTRPDSSSHYNNNIRCCLLKHIQTDRWVASQMSPEQYTQYNAVKIRTRN